MMYCMFYYNWNRNDDTKHKVVIFVKAKYNQTESHGHIIFLEDKFVNKSRLLYKATCVDLFPTNNEY